MTLSDMDLEVAGVRAFNRGWTQILELLDAGYLDTDLSLPEARVIFELAQSDSEQRQVLRDRLGMDASFLTRVLAGLEARGLTESRRSQIDRRAIDLSLTSAGRAMFRRIDRESAERINRRLAGLTADQRRTTLESMAILAHLFGFAPRDSVITLRQPGVGDLGWVIGRHGAVYADEYGWNLEFEALVATIVAAFHASDHDDGQRAWIAEVDGARAGCVYCCRKDATTAQLRILLVEPWARGLGVGRRLVDECVAFATEAGYQRIVLWTNDVLEAARGIYQSIGFRLVDEEPHHSFGVDLVGQNWELDLRSHRDRAS